jgi:uncharacterized membrane protein YkgB
MLAKKLLRAESRTSLEKLGLDVSRYGLVTTLLLIGVLKFTTGEAQGIQPLVANSPLMSWLYRIFRLLSVSNLIGVIEIVVALLIAVRPFSSRLSFIGSIGAIITFVLTVSFLLSTPGAFRLSHGFPLLGIRANSSSRILCSLVHRSGSRQKHATSASSGFIADRFYEQENEEESSHGDALTLS